MEQTECSETSAYKIQTPGNFPEESTQDSLEIFCSFPVSNSEAYLRFLRHIRTRLKISVYIYYYVEGFTLLKDLRLNFLFLSQSFGMKFCAQFSAACSDSGV